ncbi:MAG TPA: tetratricopeptide repeat protein [Thermodesulfobacteriota bacterium]|nr:tetratricopeptide repeat protein [Thermodesulfobacteriota bacterium]
MRISTYSLLTFSCLLAGCIAGPGSIQELSEKQENLENKVSTMSRDLNDVQRRLEIQGARIRSLEQNYSDMYMKMDDMQKKQVVPTFSKSEAGAVVKDAPPTGDLYQRANVLYNEGQYLNAILAYQVFIDTYPNDGKVADAYLKQGLSLVKIGRPDGAKFFFKTLIDRFPESGEAAIAKQELEKINPK